MTSQQHASRQPVSQQPVVEQQPQSSHKKERRARGFTRGVTTIRDIFEEYPTAQTEVISSGPGRSKCQVLSHPFQLDELLECVSTEQRPCVGAFPHFSEEHVRGDRECFREQFWISDSSRKKHYQTYHPDLPYEALKVAAPALAGVVRTRHDPDQVFQYTLKSKRGADLHYDLAAADDSETENKKILIKIQRVRKRAKLDSDGAKHALEKAQQAFQETERRLKQLEEEKTLRQREFQNYLDVVQKWHRFQNEFSELCGPTTPTQAMAGA